MFTMFALEALFMPKITWDVYVHHTIVVACAWFHLQGMLSFRHIHLGFLSEFSGVVYNMYDYFKRRTSDRKRLKRMFKPLMVLTSFCRVCLEYQGLWLGGLSYAAAMVMFILDMYWLKNILRRF